MAGMVILMGCGDPEGSSDSRRSGRGDPSVPDTRPVVLILGDSLTAGYGVADGLEWPALLEGRLDDLGARVINAGVSGDTTSGGLPRLPWYKSQPVVVVILALGGNDGLRGIPIATVRKNLRAMIESAGDLWPSAAVLLAGMRTPPSMGLDYAESFAEIWPKLADEEDVPLVPFLLEGVGGELDMNQDDGIHPNRDGHEVIAETVWEYLEPVLTESLAAHGY